MFPYKDDNPTLATPVVTLGLIAVNLVAWVVVQGMGSEPRLSASVCEFGMVAGEVLNRVPDGTPVPVGSAVACATGAPAAWLTPVTSMFLHGGWLHLLGNMWFLWVFGNNVEDAMGRLRFLAFYVLSGVLAAGTQAFVNPASVVPMVGASGAISGVMGGYIVLYPRVRVHMIVFLGIFITTIAVPAVFMLGYWFLLQLLGGIPALRAETGGGVAFWAHAGGFVAGLLLVLPFRNRRLMALRAAHNLPA